MNYVELSPESLTLPQVLIRPQMFSEVFRDRDIDYVEVREHIPGLPGSYFSDSFVWKNNRRADTETFEDFEIYGYTEGTNDPVVTIQGNFSANYVVVHIRYSGIEPYLKSLDHTNLTVLGSPVPFCELFRDRGFDRVEVYCYMRNAAHFCGAFSWSDNQISSLDGDDYSAGMLVFGYELFDNVAADIYNGVIVYSYTF